MTKNRFIYITNLLMAVAISLLLPTGAGSEEENTAQSKILRIGILSKRGPLIVQQRWSEMTIYLQQKIPESQFVIVPLSFEAVRPAVQNKQIDFLLTNSGMFVDLSFSFELFAIATLKRKIINQPYTEFGSVVFTRIERDGINQLSDLAATDIAAVNRQSLGGWIAALRELDTIGFSLDTVNSLDFLGTHDAVVYAVENRTVDVGIVRTDTLERMAAEHKVKLSTFKALPFPKEILKSEEFNTDFPLLHSTRLYPEWPIVSLAHVPKTLTEKMSSALLLMPSESKSAIDAQIMGWTIPKNYLEVDRAFDQLDLGFYSHQSKHSAPTILMNNLKSILIMLITIGIMLILFRRHTSLKLQLNTSQQQLEELTNKDPITGLPNRYLFFEMANRHLHIALREQKQCTLLALSINKLDTINNKFGYEVGEELLKETSKRIATELEESDLLCKVDGNKFFVLLVSNQSVNNFHAVIQAMFSSFEPPFISKNGFEINIELCAGISQYPIQGTTLSKLIQQADDAQTKSNKNSNV